VPVRVILDAAVLNDREQKVLRELAHGAGLALIETGTLRQIGHSRRGVTPNQSS
jgi:hypothetical protein